MVIATDPLTVVRCPYYILGDEFKPMVAHLDGRFICAHCGHLANPCDKNFKCCCGKCLEWQSLGHRRRGCPQESRVHKCGQLAMVTF